MDFFSRYASNTIAGSGSQYVFTMEHGEVRTGRVFYRIANGGTFEYAILFSNILDSTFADGSVSHCNLLCDAWQLHSARVGRCPADKAADWMRMNDHTVGFQPLTFGGQPQKTVMPGEMFHSDGVALSFDKGDFLCLELTFSGSMLPYHEESILPVFVQQEGHWVYDKHMPAASMIGCARSVHTRVAFLGDSITQGIGTPVNAYTHWNALVAEQLGPGFACWNLGLGYGRANDMASDGAWLYKAKKNDVVVLCAGVNDMGHIRNARQTCADLSRIVEKLRAAGCKIILQTIPPFNYQDETIERWTCCNDYIRSVLAPQVDLVFDVVPVLQADEAHPHMARYGGHPDETGCAAWAEALYQALTASGVV